MATISDEEYMHVLIDLEHIKTKFMASKEENQRLLRDLQVNVEKAQKTLEFTFGAITNLKLKLH